MAFLSSRPHKGGKDLLGTAHPKSGDDRDSTGGVCGVESLEGSFEVLRLDPWADLDAHGVGQPSQIFKMGTVQLPCALAHPEEMGSEVVVGVPLGDEAREGFLVGQVQGLVAGEDLARAEGIVPTS
jgi:hypothetical protein